MPPRKLSPPTPLVQRGEPPPFEGEGKLNPPFKFDINGNIVIGASAANIEGINDFARHYVIEWLLWHRSGRLDPRVCDIAALIVSAISCSFLLNYTLDHKIEWIEKVFLLDKLRETIPVRILDYSESTLAVLRKLRPSIALQAKSLSIERCNDLLQLALPIERMLVLGGDHRLLVDQNTQLNGYGCRPFPRPEAITFSSSTATSISKYAFDLVECRRQQFISEAIATDVENAVAKLAQEVRDGIRQQLGISSKLADVLITASGTDSFLIAQGLTRLMSDSPITTLIVGVEESGSGVKLAIQAKHFADDTALADAVHKGQPLSIQNSLEFQIDIPVRDHGGNAIPTRVLDNQVRNLVEQYIEAGHFVVLHAMNHSKLGYSGPSKALLIELKLKFNSNLCAVIDACQMRLDREDVVEYLEQGMIVIATGSKYFTGPPFCGAIIIPEQIIDAVLEHGAKFDSGFNSYCAREDLPHRMRAMLGAGSKSFNLGSLFRWVAALAEMQRYFEIPAILRVRAVSEFCKRTEEILLAAPFIELHYQNSSVYPQLCPELGELSGRRMIFPFFLYTLVDGVRVVCSEQQVRRIYALLNQDCSTQFPYQNAREFRLLAQTCHVGQPVPVMHRSGVPTAVLRISVGARIFSESFSNVTGRFVDTLIEDEYWQIGVTLSKIEMLLAVRSFD